MIPKINAKNIAINNEYTTIQGNLKSNCTNCIDFDMANLMAFFFFASRKLLKIQKVYCKKNNSLVKNIF